MAFSGNYKSLLAPVEHRFTRCGVGIREELLGDEARETGRG